MPSVLGISLDSVLEYYIVVLNVYVLSLAAN